VSNCLAEDFTIKEAGTNAIAQEDYELAYKIWLPLAEKGDSEIQFAVAMLLANGYGHGEKKPSIEQREKRALVWIRKSSLAGNNDAMKWLSDAYKNGWFNLSKNEKLSDCWKKASKSKVTSLECKVLEEKESKKKEEERGQVSY